MAFAAFDFESQYLHMNTKVGVILPNLPSDMEPEEFYGQKDKKYKVLWLLHGDCGDYSDWIRKSKIELYAAKYNLIVVMPSALNSDYVNWRTFAQGYYMEDYLIKELMPLVQTYFPASEKQEDNFIAGLAMGGNGTLKYAVDYPERFAAAAVIPGYSHGWRFWDLAIKDALHFFGIGEEAERRDIGKESF